MSASAAVRGQVRTNIELKMISDRLLPIPRPTLDMAPSFLALLDWSLLQHALLSGQERNSRKFGISAGPTSTIRFRIELNDASIKSQYSKVKRKIKKPSSFCLAR